MFPSCTCLPTRGRRSSAVTLSSPPTRSCRSRSPRWSLHSASVPRWTVQASAAKHDDLSRLLDPVSHRAHPPQSFLMETLLGGRTCRPAPAWSGDGVDGLRDSQSLLPARRLSSLYRTLSLDLTLSSRDPFTFT